MSSAVVESSTHAIACEVESFDGTHVAYDLYDHTSRTLVLVVPGFWRFRRHPSMTGFAALLNDHGYRAAVLDPRGHGDSGGTYGFNLHEHHDVAAVANDLLHKLPIDGICLIGFSYGGSIAISTAARHELPITSLFLVSPVADFGKIAPKLNPLTMHRHIAWTQAFHPPRFVLRSRKSAKLEAIDDVRQVHVPIAFVHVKDDWLINHKHSEMLYAAANEPKELHVMDIPGQFHADHIFKVAGERIGSLVQGFLDSYAVK